MKARNNQPLFLSTSYRDQGSPLVYQGYHTCRDLDILRIWEPGTVHGDFKKPNPFGFTKITSSGLRATTRCIAPSQLINPYGWNREEGPRNSLLDNNTILAPDNLSSKAYELATQKLVSSVRGDLDVSIDLFQFRQFLQTSERILRLTRTLQKSWQSATKGKGPLKEAADLYLEYTYGIAPSVQTLVDLYKKLYEQGLAQEGLVHCRGRGQLRDRILIKTVIGIIPFGNNVPIVYSCEQSARCQIDIYLKPELTQVQKLAGYTSLSPINWLYEMTPLSFVLDWFWNLGGYLRAMETMLIHQLRFHSGCVTYTLKHDTTVDSTSVVDYNGTSSPFFIMENISGCHTFKQTNRSVLSTFPVPKLPSWNPSLGSRRMLNAAALLSQLLPDMFGKDSRYRLPSWPKLRPIRNPRP